MYNLNTSNVVSDLLSIRIDKYHSINQQIKDLEKVKDSLSKDIKTHLKEKQSQEYCTRNYKATLSVRSRKYLSKDLLTEMGVDDETLELCSEVVEYTTLTVK